MAQAGTHVHSATRDELRLLARLRDGDERAFAELVDRCHGTMLAVAQAHVRTRASAEEVVQEVFTRAWRHAATYDARRGSVRTWLYQIARHAIIDTRRRASVRPALALHAPADTEAGEAGPTIEQAMLGWQVAAALERLTPEHRQMIRMAQFRGLSMREIAQRTGLPLGTVKSRTWYALRSLRLVLEEMGLVPR